MPNESLPNIKAHIINSNFPQEKEKPKEESKKILVCSDQPLKNFFNLSNKCRDKNETKLSLLKNNITNINYNLLYFLSHDINFPGNSDNLSLFVSKNKIILYHIYNFINTTYRVEFKKFLSEYNMKLNDIQEVYKSFEKNAKDKILGSHYFELNNCITEIEKSINLAIKKHLKKNNSIKNINPISNYLIIPEHYFVINHKNRTFDINSDYDIDRNYQENINRYMTFNNIVNLNSDVRFIALNDLTLVIKKLKKFKEFYDYIYNTPNDDDINIAKFNDTDYNRIYDNLKSKFYSIIIDINLIITEINTFFNQKIDEIIRNSSNIFKYQDEYKKNFENFIIGIKKIYKIKKNINDKSLQKSIDFKNFIDKYNRLYLHHFDIPFKGNKLETFKYKIPTCSIESEFYKENKVIEVDTYNISIPYNKKIINYNVKYIKDYQYLLKNIFYINKDVKYYYSDYTKHQILWALIQNTFLIFNEIINILLHFLSKINNDYDKDDDFDIEYEFKVKYKLGIYPLVINEIFIDIKNINIVFNNLIFIFIIPRLMLISKIYNHPGNTLDNFFQSTYIKLYYFEDFF